MKIENENFCQIYTHTHTHTLITLKLSELSQSGHTDVNNMPVKK